MGCGAPSKLDAPAVTVCVNVITTTANYRGSLQKAAAMLGEPEHSVVSAVSDAVRSPVSTRETTTS